MELINKIKPQKEIIGRKLIGIINSDYDDPSQVSLDLKLIRRSIKKTPQLDSTGSFELLYSMQNSGCYTLVSEMRPQIELFLEGIGYKKQINNNYI